MLGTFKAEKARRSLVFPVPTLLPCEDELLELIVTSIYGESSLSNPKSAFFNYGKYNEPNYETFETIKLVISFIGSCLVRGGLLAREMASVLGSLFSISDWLEPLI